MSNNNWSSDYTVQSAEYLESKVRLLTRLTRIANSMMIWQRQELLTLIAELRGEQGERGARGEASAS